MRNEIPGMQGVLGLIVAIGVTCTVMTVQSGLVASLPAWIACGSGLMVGWQALKAIHRK